jgi:NADH-quinone oxidoreductase subunit L
MAEDPGYQRFFSYISLFTFAMLMLVMANNFLQLFFGWEAVGLVSYLLIGFWYTRESAIYASLKAFLVNRVGDLGFLLGIGLVLAHFGTLDYEQVFALAPSAAAPMTLICILLFVGAMGKSAQFPLHVWLPDSMEGPTPISALIHAATMVTAGIFMVARMSPLYELSETARSVVLIIGAITALFMGLVALTQYDIKRVVAYSTLSQLGYMTAALGASAYSAAMFHLMTHAFFKALLFLAAGSVIVALHHEQDMRRMGGLKKYMPVTYWTMLIGAIASAGIPGFSGFFSKDAIIEAVRHSGTPGHLFAWLCVLSCVYVTAAYTFRMVFMAFHGEPRFDPAHPPHESPAVVTLPLVLLAIPSVVAGYFVGPMVYGNFFGKAVPPTEGEFHGVGAFMLHGLVSLPFWFAVAGIATAYLLYMKRKDLPKKIAMRLGPLYALVERKYGFDELYSLLFAGGARLLGKGFWRGGDQTVIDGLMVNGSARVVGWFSGVVRLAQSGLVNQYAVAMLIGVLILAFWFARK